MKWLLYPPSLNIGKNGAKLKGDAGTISIYPQNADGTLKQNIQCMICVEPIHAGPWGIYRNRFSIEHRSSDVERPAYPEQNFPGGHFFQQKGANTNTTNLIFDHHRFKGPIGI
jgi:hypothetical protein